MNRTGGTWLAELRTVVKHPILAGVALVLALVPVVFDPRLYDDFTLPKQALLTAVCGIVIVPGLLLKGGSLPRSPVVRWAFNALCAWTVLSWATGLDPRGSLIGIYQYRQGLLTFLCYAVLFLAGGYIARRDSRLSILAVPALVGLAITVAYTIVQSTGNDPFSWWLDTRIRAIGTIGNANELASYAIITLAFAGAFAARKWLGPALIFLTVGSVTLIAFESESRTGIVALVAFAILVPATSLIAGVRARQLPILGAPVIAGILAGALLSSQFGAGASAPAARVKAGFSGSDSSGSTRVALVEGTLPSIRANVLTGAGPDGLYLEFPKNRPAGLGGVFEEFDLTVQSAHNWPLDTAANLGIPGLLVLVVLLGACGWASVRGEFRQGDASIGFAWAGVLAYGAMTLANPLSLAAHAIFWLLLGWLARRREVSAEPQAVPGVPSPTLRYVRLGSAGAVGLGGLLVAVLMPIADLKANSGWDAYATFDFEAAARHYDDAYRYFPLVRDYKSREGKSWLAAGVPGDRNALENANRAFADLEDDYSLTFDDAIAYASAKLALARPVAESDAAIDRAVELNPEGIFTADYTARLREAARKGAVLEYEIERRWVVVTVAEP